VASSRFAGARWLSWPKGLGSCLTLLTIVAIGASLVSGKNGPLMQVTRLLGAAATVSESTAGAASAAIMASADLGLAFSTIVVAATQSTLSFSQGVWHGVDLLNVSVRQASGTIAVDDSVVVAEWLRSDAGKTLAPVRPHIAEALRAAVHSISLSMPHVRHQEELLVPDGTYFAFAVEARLLASGYVGLQFGIWEANFTPQWVNPAWEALSWPFAPEALQITLELGVLFNSTPLANFTWPDLADASLATGSLPSMVSARMKRWWRLMRLMVRGILQWLLFF
jgi:hypothetical protein